MESRLVKKEEEMKSLMLLHENYRRAGVLVDQSHRKVLLDQMVTVHRDIETESVQMGHLKSKVSRITASGAFFATHLAVLWGCCALAVVSHLAVLRGCCALAVATHLAVLWGCCALAVATHLAVL
jgi:uncharacterized membrane protein YwaF